MSSDTTGYVISFHRHGIDISHKSPLRLYTAASGGYNIWVHDLRPAYK